MAETKRKIAVAADFSKGYGRNFFAGILRSIRLDERWDVRVISSPTDFTPEAIAAMAGDGTKGLITCEMDDPRVWDALGGTSIPVVVVGSWERRLPESRPDVAYVTIDEKSVGVAAAEYYASLGRFMSYGFVHSARERNRSLSLLRWEGFRKTLASKGIEASALARGGNMKAYIESLPKPAALFAPSDADAALAVEACHDAGVKVPGRVSVLGVDNDETVCLSCNPPLSSILPGAEEEGVAAMETLVRLLDGGRQAPQKTVVCRTGAEAIERGSTAPVKPASHLIRSALAFIAENAHLNIKAPDVVAHLGVSRRLAEIRFREFLGKGIAQAILDAKLDRLAAAVEASKRGSHAKAIRDAGFVSAAHARTAFKRRFGVTIGEYAAGAADDAGGGGRSAT